MRDRIVVRAIVTRRPRIGRARPGCPTSDTDSAFPDESIEVSISIGGAISYSVRVDGQPLIAPSRLGLRLRNGTMFGQDVELVSANHQTSDTTWENRLGKRRNVRDHHNQLQLLLRERSASGRTFEVVFRAFNDGVAFRYELLSQPGMRDFVLEEELTRVRLSRRLRLLRRRAGEGVCRPAGMGIRTAAAERHQAGVDHRPAAGCGNADRLGGDRGGRPLELGRTVDWRRRSADR